MGVQGRSNIPVHKLSELGSYLFDGMRKQQIEPTARAMAAMLGVSPSAAGRWLIGRSRPPGTTLQLLAVKLDLDLEVLQSLAGIVPPASAVRATGDADAVQMLDRNGVAARLAFLTGSHSPLPAYLAARLADQLCELAEAYNEMLVVAD